VSDVKRWRVYADDGAYLWTRKESRPDDDIEVVLASDHDAEVARLKRELEERDEAKRVLSETMGIHALLGAAGRADTQWLRNGIAHAIALINTDHCKEALEILNLAHEGRGVRHPGCEYLCLPGRVCDKCGQLVPAAKEDARSAH